VSPRPLFLDPGWQGGNAVSGAYYNEHDPQSAAWLRALILAGEIAEGDVDERSVADVRADDLRGYCQLHFFAGIGGFSRALRLAGWPDELPIVTGSCPCQSFSAAGGGAGFDDPRHLWPAWFRLIRELRPATVIGEQVEAAIGFGWLDLVFGDLESEGYACGAAVLGACSVGAPHIRKRLYWVADHTEQGRARRRAGEAVRGAVEPGRRGAVGGVADAEHAKRRPGDATREYSDWKDAGGSQGAGVSGERGGAGRVGNAAVRGRGIVGDAPLAGRSRQADGAIEPGGVGDTGEQGLERHGWDGDDGDKPGWQRTDSAGSVAPPGDVGNPWDDAVWIPCRDGKLRAIQGAAQPGTEPLADEFSGSLGRCRIDGVEVYAPLIEKGEARTMRLRGYGNAIVPPLAAEFIRAYLDTLPEK